MKKTLLSMAAMLLLATGASAQKLDLTVAGEANVDSRFNKFEQVAAPKANGMKKLKEGDKLLGFPASATPVANVGWPRVPDAASAASQLMLDESWYGYTVIGIRYLLLGSLGENTEETPVGVYVWGIPESGKQEDLLAAEKMLSEGDYELCVVRDQQLTANWNETYFDTPFKLSDKTVALRYGFMYVQDTNDDDGNLAAAPFLMGKFGDEEEFPDPNSGNAPFLVFGTFGEKQDWYLYSASDYPYALCVQVIVRTPNGETAILGVDASGKAYEKQYYSLDGKQLSAPQKGINVVKMSDGTSKKVLVK
ncbi:hypothetical protein [Leyella stercorea]|uniref:hypothetical protein n=1 Tax=Leyella stercorea TaxID=363265 RepID=UPI004025C13C